MAIFECNFNSWSRGRTVTITAMIPTGNWNDFGFTDDMKNSIGAVPPDNFTDTVNFVPLWKRVKTGSHKPLHKYPVLYLLCGGMDDRRAWLYQTQASVFCEERKIALVLVDPEDAEWYMNRDIEFFSEEVHQFVCAMLPVSDAPSDRYMAGYSRGTGGAVHHMLHAPDAFGAVGLFSAAMTVYEDDPVGMTKQFFNEGKKLPPVYMSTGDQDPAILRFKFYRDLLKENGADVTYDEIAGYSHGYRVCNAALEKFLDWLPRTDPYAGNLYK